MFNLKSIYLNFIKQEGYLYDLLFYLSFAVTILISVVMEKNTLIYFTPVVIFTLLLKYINITKGKPNYLYIIGLIAIIISDILTFKDFDKLFSWITILTSIYLICSSLILKQYLNKSKLENILFLSVLIGLLLASYIIYSVLDLLIKHLSNTNLLYTIMITFILITYVISCAIIYINDYYDNATLILTSGIFCMFHIALTPINEFIYFTQTFTVLITITHVISIYLCMKFIAETEIIKKENLKKKYF